MLKKLKAFRTAREREMLRLGRFFGAVAVFLILFLVMSAVYIGVRSGGFSFKEPESISETGSSAVAPEVSGVKNLLLVSASTDKTEIYFLSVVQINFEDDTYTISSFSPRETVTADNEFATFLEHYQTGGVKRLVRAVETLNGIQIDKYIASTENSFKRAINIMGSVTFEFPEQINYRCEDFAIVLIEGKQKLRGDDLLKYMRYCGALGDTGLKMQSKAIGELFRQYITEKNLSKKDNLYSALISSVTSDISVLDFKKSGEMLRYMQVTDFEVNCIDYFRVIVK